MHDIGPIYNYIILHYDTNVADVHFAMCYYHWLFATAHLVTKILMSVKSLSREWVLLLSTRTFICTNFFFFFRLFPIRGRHSGFSISSCSYLRTVSSSVTSTSAMSSFTTSINLLFGLPRFLFPGNSVLGILLPKSIPIIFPQYMAIPPQSRLSCFLSKPSHLCCPSDVLIPDFVHSCHS